MIPLAVNFVLIPLAALWALKDAAIPTRSRDKNWFYRWLMLSNMLVYLPQAINIPVMAILIHQNSGSGFLSGLPIAIEYLVSSLASLAFVDVVNNNSRKKVITFSLIALFPSMMIPVFFVFPVPALADSLFELQAGEAHKFEGADPQTNFGTNLINSIGLYLNTKCREIFPAGVSVNFVRIHPDNTIEYRCFERGIARETLACGTGTLACAYVSHHLRGLHERIIKVLPHRCRWYDPAARTQVSHDRSVWMLESSPTMLFKGEYLAIQQVLQSAKETAMKNPNESASAPSTEHAPNTDVMLTTPAINFS